jgi:hypothetical protein
VSGQANSHAAPSIGSRAGGEEQPCGCKEGAAAAFAALALLLLQAVGVLELPLVGSGIWSWLGLVFAAALAGKLLGIAAAIALQRSRGDRGVGGGR